MSGVPEQTDEISLFECKCAFVPTIKKDRANQSADGYKNKRVGKLTMVLEKQNGVGGGLN